MLLEQIKKNQKRKEQKKKRTKKNHKQKGLIDILKNILIH